MKLLIKKDKIEKYSESQMHEYYYIEGLPKNIECKFKVIYGYNYRNFNISPNEYYQTFVDIDNDSLFISLWYDNFYINCYRQEYFEEIIKVIIEYIKEKFIDYNIYFYDMPNDLERKIIEKYTQPIHIGKYKAIIYLLNK
ncbi:hypothetical protein EAI30_06715 [Romboutsia ilealis]|uniref:Staygreen protein domain-containing protein n=1 Tax=Romboutsia faecis TaxID=2764597 RepID=A0ABR7JPE8_9FIRM|nr:hypothetical protein [Romboutsia faecis]MBC5996777.1 hypothetical protein [Romboutsia faecis]MRN24304.1 hypothetical protein [Romboutsia ilealis]